MAERRFETERPMPRLPRLDHPGTVQHLVQRGVDRQPAFFCNADRRHYLGALREAAWKHECEVHAYVLMTNHVHLLAREDIVGIREHLSKQRALGSLAFQRQIEQQLGRRARIGTPGRPAKPKNVKKVL
jgi:REP element-mobilizing transposase RayT